MPGYDHQHKASRAEVAIKWTSSVVMALLFLVCLIHSKISLLALSSAMHASNDNLSRDARCRMFILLQIISLAPHVINLIRGVWGGVLRRDRKWPKGKVMVFATIVSIMEAVGLCSFMFYIPGLSKTYHAVLLMNCVIVCPLLDTIWNIRRLNFSKQSLQQYCCCKFTSVYALMCVVVGIVCTIFLLLHTSIRLLVIAPISVILLSIAWSPSVQKYMAESKRITPKSRRNDGSWASNSSKQCNDSPFSFGQNTCENTTWKLTALMSVVKLLSTFGFSMLILFLSDMSPLPENFNGVDIDTYKNAWITLFDCSREELFYFYTHIASGFVGYLAGYIACKTHSHRLGFSIPLALATPISVIMLVAENKCNFFLPLLDNEDNSDCTITLNSIMFLTIATTAFFLAQAFSTWWILFESDFNIMLREDQLFWTPMYNSALLEHWIMLARRNEVTNEENKHLQPFQMANDSKLFICTTMYKEDDQEMKQLLESFKLFNNHAFRAKGYQIQFHIFFDGAVKAGKPTEYLLQLVVLFEEVFGTNVGFFTKRETPYGLSLSLRLPRDRFEGSDCIIHLKDKLKVKSKKRWSQVMYMKYALHDIQAKGNSEQSYILATDADVKFTPKSVETLLNLIARDDSVGAVCARTHPLGSGLLVWYQIFEYAIGHWFQKAAEHVLGSVLCAPGCFSVYRLNAINEVLNLYATDVEKAEEFLTKDMGEDRWLCTLLVQKGWRIEYCATSTNSTHCPEDFDQFFKQRRRWIVSTLANQWLLIKGWSLIKKNNLRVSFLFKIYQIVLLMSTLIGPSSVILVVSGGLKFGTDWNPSVTLSIQVAASVCYGIICLNSSSRTQLMIGKFYCCLYTLFMMIALVGTAVEIATDITGQPGAEKNFISDDLKLSSTSVYLIGMAAIFLITAVLHLTEFWIIFYGFVGDAGERRRLLWNTFYFCLWKELLLLAVNFMLC